MRRFLFDLAPLHISLSNSSENHKHLAVTVLPVTSHVVLCQAINVWTAKCGAEAVVAVL